MARMKHCAIELTDGEIIQLTSVLIKAGGWIRVGDEHPYRYIPEHRVNEIKHYKGAEV